MIGKSFKAAKLLFLYPALSLLPVGFAYRLSRFFSPMEPQFQKRYMEQWKNGLKRYARTGGALIVDGNEKCACKHLSMLSMEALDSYLVPRLGRDSIKKVASIKGISHVHDALLEQKGLIVVTSHFCRLNMTAYTLGHLGIKNGILSQAVDDNPNLDWIDRLYLKTKLRKYYRVTKGPGITLSDNPRLIYRALEKNQIMVILMDAYPDTLKRFISLPFLGGRLKLPTGIARISQKTGAPLVFAVVRPGRGWRVEIEIMAVKGRGEDGLREALILFEKEVKKNPCQWWQWPYMETMWKGPGD